MTFTPRTWVVGEVVTAALLNQEVRDQFNSMFAAWTTFTSSWTSSGTAPAIGNGTINGRYMKFGRNILCEIHTTMGSTTTYGSGNYSWSLPVQAASGGIAQIGNAQLLGSGGVRWVGQIVISSAATTCSAFLPVSSTDTRTDFLTATRPETLASTAQVRLTFMYEAAS